jgi:hypothetical protein
MPAELFRIPIRMQKPVAVMKLWTVNIMKFVHELKSLYSKKKIGVSTLSPFVQCSNQWNYELLDEQDNFIL